MKFAVPALLFCMLFANASAHAVESPDCEPLRIQIKALESAVFTAATTEERNILIRHLRHREEEIKNTGMNWEGYYQYTGGH